MTPSTDKQSRQDNDPNFEHELERQAEQNGREKTPDQLESGQRESKQLPKLVYMGIIFIMVIISTVVISANGEFVLVPTIYRVTKVFGDRDYVDIKMRVASSIYKVSTCLALRRKCHLQVNQICVPEYICHPVLELR